MASDASMTEDFPGGDDKRSYFRVATRILVRCREIKPGERGVLEDEIHRPGPTRAKSVDPALGQWLDRIEGKLDKILSLLAHDHKTPLGEADRQEVVLSGAGMRLVFDRALEEGSEVLLRFELPGSQSEELKCIARVVGVQPDAAKPGGFELSAGFAEITDTHRDRVLNHVMAVQRTMLRRRSEAGSAS